MAHVLKISPVILGKVLLSANRNIQFQDRKNTFLILETVKEWIGEDVAGFPLTCFKELFEQINLLTSNGITERELVLNELREHFRDENSLGEEADIFLEMFQEISTATVEQIRIMLENELKEIEILPTLSRMQELIILIETAVGSTRDKYLAEYAIRISEESRRIKTIKSASSGINSAILSGFGLRELAEATHQELNDSSCMLATGIPEIDSRTGGGFKNGTATIFAAPTGNFKSGLLLNAALGVCENNPNIIMKDRTKKPFVYYLSHENKPTLSFKRFAKYVLNLSEAELKVLSPEDVAKKIEDVTKDWAIQIKLDYIRAYTLDPEKISNLLTGVTDEDGNEMECVGLFHDYLYLLKTDSNDYRLSLSRNMRVLADIAIEEGIPVITLAQLNSEAELMKVLTARAFGESKAVLQHCDDAFLFRLQQHIPLIKMTHPLLPETTNKFKFIECFHIKARSQEDHDSERFLIPFCMSNNFKLAQDDEDTIFKLYNHAFLCEILDKKFDLNSKTNKSVAPVSMGKSSKPVNGEALNGMMPEDDDPYGGMSE